jgi:hypothetical protein
LDQAEAWDDDKVLVCEDAPLPDAELEEPVCVVALLAPPSPAPAVVDEELEVWAFEPADPEVEDPEVAVCVPADPDPLPELGSGSFKVTVPIVTGGNAVVLLLGLVDPAPPLEVEVELPVVVPAVDPLLAPVEGAPVLEPPLVCVFDEAPPPDAADDPEVVVFADADPEAGALDAELEELVVVLAAAPVDDEPVSSGVVPAGLVVFEEFLIR